MHEMFEVSQDSPHTYLRQVLLHTYCYYYDILPIYLLVCKPLSNCLLLRCACSIWDRCLVVFPSVHSRFITYLIYYHMYLIFTSLLAARVVNNKNKLYFQNSSLLKVSLYIQIQVYTYINTRAYSSKSYVFFRLYRVIQMKWQIFPEHYMQAFIISFREI